MAENNSESGEGSIRLSRQGIQPLYFERTLAVIQSMDESLKNMSGSTDQRPVYLARQVINRILDDDIRHKLLAALDAKIAEITANTNDNEKKSHLIRLAAIDSTGEVVSYLDEFLAVHRAQVIGEV